MSRIATGSGTSNILSIIDGSTDIDSGKEAVPG
jgi:hypothetical protein